MTLKTCPECCAPATLHLVPHNIAQTFYIVVCQSCGAGPNKAFRSEKLAIHHWNKGQHRRSRSAKMVEAVALSSVPDCC